MKFTAIATLRRGRLEVGEELEADEQLKAQAQMDEDRGWQSEHGVRIPYWSNEARVIWNPHYQAEEHSHSNEQGPHVKRLVALATKRGAA